jgi:hypothetical protein
LQLHSLYPALGFSEEEGFPHAVYFDGKMVLTGWEQLSQSWMSRIRVNIFLNLALPSADRTPPDRIGATTGFADHIPQKLKKKEAEDCKCLASAVPGKPWEYKSANDRDVAEFSLGHLR